MGEGREIALPPDGTTEKLAAGASRSSGGRWLALVGGAIWLTLAAVTLFRGLRAPEAHVRPFAESLVVVAQALLIATPGIIAFAPVGKRSGRLRVATFAGGALAAVTLPFGIVLAIPAYLMWRGGGRDATAATGPRAAGLWVGLGLSAASYVVPRLHDGTMTCWVERVTAYGSHEYIILSSHNGVSGRSALGDVAGGCAQFPTAAAASLSLGLAVAGLFVLLISASRQNSLATAR